MTDLTKREEREKLRHDMPKHLRGAPLCDALLDACDTLEQQRDKAQQYAQKILQGYTGMAKQRDAALGVLEVADRARLFEESPAIREKAREVLRAAGRLK